MTTIPSSMFWHAKNLTELTLHNSINPWDYPMPEVPADVRSDKKARQNWYKAPTTQHYFYTGIEGANPNMRPSKENPPRAIHAFAVDYDLKISKERVTEAIETMTLKPSWVERSLGGNVRLVWLLPRPLPVETYEFCAFILDKAVSWLQLGLLPGLDEAAFTSPTRLLCNGGDWAPTGFPAITENSLQAFFVACGKEFRFNGPEGGATIPLDLVEAELKKRYPSFNWPSDFVAETQGPTFWIPESTSPTSAILKLEGMITFAAHAAKPFYSWTDLLGVEFVKQFHTNSIAKATQEIYWDGKKFWRKKEGIYTSVEGKEMSNHFKVACRLSTKPGPGGVSAVDVALDHIYNHGAVQGAAPFVFQPSGVLNFQGKRVLNTYNNLAVRPHPEPCEWEKDFPFLSSVIDCMFDPPEQKFHWLAWWKHGYTAALNQIPMPGQNIFLMGPASKGKSLVNRLVVGKSLGGHVDASDFLIKGGNFNSELFDAPLWSIDDETASNSESSRQNFSAMIKKCTANSTFRYNKKFEVSVMVEWMGRIFITINMDHVSSRLLGAMDNTSKDKTSLFRCAENTNLVFPSRQEIIRLIEIELPKLLRWLLDWTPPEFVIPDVRFGYQSYHEPTLLDKSQQGSKSAPFKELLVESLIEYFKMKPEATEWRGTTVQLLRLLHLNPANDYVMRSLRLEQVTRYLEAIQREGMLLCQVETGKMKERIWIFGKIE